MKIYALGSDFFPDNLALDFADHSKLDVKKLMVPTDFFLEELDGQDVVFLDVALTDDFESFKPNAIASSENVIFMPVTLEQLEDIKTVSSHMLDLPEVLKLKPELNKDNLKIYIFLANEDVSLQNFAKFYKEVEKCMK